MFVFGTEVLRFKSRAGQIGHCVAGGGPLELVTRFSVTQRV